MKSNKPKVVAVIVFCLLSLSLIYVCFFSPRYNQQMFIVKEKENGGSYSDGRKTKIEASNFISSDSMTPSSFGDKPKNLMVIDCFPYNGELIVPARLALLNPYIDLFFISEPPLTFSGVRKERLFKDINADVFKPYEDKIIWIDTKKIESVSHKDAWAMEAAQRNAGNASFYEAMDEGRLSQPFVVINSDADEIPNPSIIQKVMPGQSLYNESLQDPIFLSMQMFYYNFNWLKKSDAPPASLVHSKHLLERNLSLQDIRRSKYPRQRKIFVDDGGWHCSFCTSVEDIINKLNSFSHQEYNREPYTSRKHIQDCIMNGKDIFKRKDSRYFPYHNNFTQYLPEELQEFNKALVSIQI